MEFKISLAELHTGLSRSSFIRNFGNIDILHSILLLSFATLAILTFFIQFSQSSS